MTVREWATLTGAIICMSGCMVAFLVHLWTFLSTKYQRQLRQESEAHLAGLRQEYRSKQ